MKVAALALGAACALAPALALAQPAAERWTERWTYSVMPYLWLPGVDGTLRYGPPSAGGATPNVSVDADTLLGSLEFAFMLSGEARKGRWLIATDFIYLDLSADSSTVRSIDFNPGSGPVNVGTTALDTGSQTRLEGTVWTLVGGYAAVQNPRLSLDVIGGFRYLGLETTTDWQLSAAVTGPAGAQTFTRTGSVTKSDDLWDAIVGVRGRVKLGEGNWFMPYYLDAGAGDSRLTWQGVLGVGHGFKWGEIIFAYRYLSYEQGDNKLIEELSFGGLGLGVNFRF
ncbi:MAG TPA: hypothetical protein VGX52_12930 [Burkholderiales bacterium]|nr:hypothetical protein [Burkholderiales bacterium]